MITCLSVYCGNCEPCLTGHLSLCLGKDAVRRAPGAEPRLTHAGQEAYPLLDMGSFAERMLIHEHGLVKIREDMPLDRAALIGCGVTTGVGAVFNTAKVEPGSTVAVIGCGGVGLNCIQGAAIAGAGKVIAVDMLESKLELARQFGATHTVDASQGDPVGQVRDLAGGGVHYAFEAIGMKQTSEQAFGMLRAGGTCTVIGMIPIGQSVEIPGYELLAEKKLIGLEHGLEPVPRRHAALHRPLPRRPPQARRARVAPHQPRRGERRLRRHEGRRGRPLRHHVRVAVPPLG